jgi:two-component system LytT family response regulator
MGGSVDQIKKTKMRVLIIDDERLARNELNSLLKEFKQVEVVGEAKNGYEGIEKIKELSPDLLFLDIHMPEMTGFQMLKKLEDIPEVIFVTAHDEYAMAAFEAEALAYILKPINTEQLAKALDKAAQRLNESDFSSEVQTSGYDKVLTKSDRIFLKDGEKCFYPRVADIRYFESHGNYVRIFFNDDKPMILRSLNSLEEKLCPKTFFRANRKYIINLEFVSAIENWFNGGMRATLLPGEQIEISRRQAIKFKDSFGI